MRQIIRPGGQPSGRIAFAIIRGHKTGMLVVGAGFAPGFVW
ncbi:hypothetical protein [uncultured Mobiluncus sp.]|nr:hypothetical protein [uncultured Mobiluncus sp.]